MCNSIYLSVRFLLGNGALLRESLVLWPLTEKGIIHVCSHVVKRKILWKRPLKNLAEGRGEQRKRKIKERTWKLVLKVSHNLFHGFFFSSFSFCTHLLFSFSCFLPPSLRRAPSIRPSLAASLLDQNAAVVLKHSHERHSRASLSKAKWNCYSRWWLKDCQPFFSLQWLKNLGRI